MYKQAHITAPKRPEVRPGPEANFYLRRYGKEHPALRKHDLVKLLRHDLHSIIPSSVITRHGDR